MEYSGIFNVTMGQLKENFLRFRHLAQIDRPVFYGVLTKGWSAVSGPVSLFMIWRYFTPDVQGFYYTFSSLLALQVFVELGLSQVIVQFVSHEWSQLELDTNGRLVGNEGSLSRLRSITRSTFHWYGFISLILILCLGVGGFMYFPYAQHTAVNWKASWVALSVSSGFLLLSIPAVSIVEGCNQIAFLNTFRFYQSVVLSFILWGSIYAGANLWALVFMTSVNAMSTLLVLWWRYRAFFIGLLHAPGVQQLVWVDDVWPMQWRIGVGWLSGYFSFALFTPVIFAYEGPAMAGRMGMTWNLLSAVTGIASTWVVTKIPTYGMLLAKKDYVSLDKLFARTATNFIVLVFVGLFVAWGFICFLNLRTYSIASRLLSPLPAGLFCLGLFFQNSSAPFSAYLRAHKKEPYMPISLAQGILTTVTTLVLGRYYGINGIAAGFFLVTTLIAPLAIIIWSRCRLIWHSPDFKG